MTRSVSIFAALFLAATASAQTVTADLKAYGSACGSVQIIPVNPLVGKKFTVTTKSKDATKGILAAGLKRANVWVGSCKLYVQPMFFINWSSTTKGTSVLTWSIPNNKSLLGVKFTVQTAAQNTVGWALSRGVEGTIGNKAPEE